jgi:hnRNP-L/PTB/hephaestus splicing factor
MRSGSDHRDAREKNPTKVLMCEVTNVKYPVTVDVVRQVFEKHGTVEKIVTFTRQEKQHAFVQLDSVQSASNAKQLLDGRNIYSQCNQLTIRWSGLQDLNVKPGDDRAADYTPLITPILQTPPTTSVAGPIRNRAQPSTFQPQESRVVTTKPYQRPPVAEPALLRSSRVQNNSRDNQTYSDTQPQSQNNRKYESGTVPEGPSGYIISVSNVAPEVTPHDLFILFGVYGDVLRVKLMHKQPGQALVQFRTTDGAAAAEAHLNECPFYDRDLHVRINKMTEIKMPPGHATEEERLKSADYANSKLHRFRFEGSQNFRHICKPTKQLHVSNLPPTADQSAVASLMETVATPIKVVMFPPKENSVKRMAIVEFEDVPTAVQALVSLHDQDLDGSNVRMTFSQKTADDVELAKNKS